MFDIESFREYCLAKKGVTEELPFGDDTLVYKVLGKMFALTGINSDPFSLNLKCDPEMAIQLRERYPAVQPGYHMNKRHWNTIVVDGSIPIKEINNMIDSSYQLVVAGLPAKLRQSLES